MHLYHIVCWMIYIPYTQINGRCHSYTYSAAAELFMRKFHRNAICLWAVDNCRYITYSVDDNAYFM